MAPSLPTHRRRRRSPAALAARLTLLTLATTAAAGGCSRSRPETEPPAPTSPGTPAGQPSSPSGAAATTPDVAGGRRAFVYTPGAYRYALSTEAVLDYRPDSVAVGYSDTVATSAIVAFTLAGGSGNRVQISGSVDSFSVSKVLGSAFSLPSSTGGAGNAGGALPAPAGSSGPLLFRGTLELTGSRRLELPAPSGSCDSPDDALLVSVREVIAPPPPSLEPGTSWQDTVDYSVCRASIPAATRLIRTFVVEGPGQMDSLTTTPAIRVRRTSALTMTGSAQVRDQTVALDGTGSGTAELYFDPIAGHFLGANAENTVTVTVSGGAHRRTFAQRGKVGVRRRE